MRSDDVNPDKVLETTTVHMLHPSEIEEAAFTVEEGRIHATLYSISRV